MSVIHTVGVIRLRDAKTGERTGTIDICRDTDGVVHLRAVRAGDEVVLRMLPDVAQRVAKLLDEAAEASAA
jgi:hypothetical protein